MKDDAMLFERGKEVLGKSAGGMIAKLLRAKDHNLSAALDAIEIAATKQDPREYIGAMIAKLPAADRKGEYGTDWW